MHKTILLVFLLAIAQAFKLLPLTKNRMALNKIKGPQIGPGRGYSTDRQQISSIVCFNINTSPYSKTESVVRLDQGARFAEIQKSLKIDVSAKVGMGMFSLEADFAFLKEIKDSDFAMSINYYQFVQSELTLETGYGPAGALTLDGMRAYGSVDNPNPRFGLICGDKFISSFKVGANLVFSMKLQFQSHSEKNTFEAKLGVSFGSFLSISADIQRTAAATNIIGKVEIMAYQSGGNPAELAKILNSTCGSTYCAASCSMQNMISCTGAVNGLIKYASTNFPNQVNLKDPSTLSPFSMGFADLQDVKWLGLAIPTFYATKQVVAMRETIGNELLKNQYYFDAMSSLVAQTKLPLVKDSVLYKTIVNVKSYCKANVDVILDQYSGGIICFKDPQSCLSDGSTLLSNLQSINSSVNYLFEMLRYKLKVDICLSEFYAISETQWYFPMFDRSICQSLSISAYSVSQNNLSYNITAKLTDNLYHIYTTIGNLTAKDNDAPFEGSRQDYWGSSKTTSTSVPRAISEYSFALYSS